MSSREVIAKGVPHPFNCYSSTDQLNPEAFSHIDGAGGYEQYSWNGEGNNFEPDIDAGPAVAIDMGNVDLYENEDAITVVLSDLCMGYRYPKKCFKLIRRNT